MTFGRMIAAAMLCTVMAGPAFALDVTKTATIAASPDATWKAIGDFCGIANWHPAIAKCEQSMMGKSTMRTLTLNGGGTIVEKLLGRSESKMKYSYAITESPLPVAGYKSTISVKKSGMGAVITWTGHFSAKGAPDDKAVEVISGIYQAGLDSLTKKLTM